MRNTLSRLASNDLLCASALSRFASAIGRRMFVRLAWPQTDDVRVVEFVFQFFLDVLSVSFAPRKNTLIKRADRDQRAVK